ncbi:MAG: hypothetical protein FHOMOCKG_00090 [Methanophagales virus GBV302]|uniref:Uncharacterized protein n=1 Tax=Methanophagales virus GBV302 TaxID=2999281 RepID=A0A9E8VGA8_9CAUD|nr:MAG: hypothetical protein QIT37_gp090 [Methanophagales virus GBV302]WAE39618.1 MAG: hypothetical protein FHOMOCKG_00090 [Methanophagales virus GBV302]
MIGERVAIYNTKSGLKAQETKANDEVIAVGERHPNGELISEKKVPFAAYPWIASNTSLYYWGDLPDQRIGALVGYGRLFRYVAPWFLGSTLLPYLGSRSGDVWLDDEGTLWTSVYGNPSFGPFPHQGIFRIPFSAWGTIFGEFIELPCQGKFVLGNDYLYTYADYEIHAYDRHTLEHKWTTSVGEVSRFYWDENNDLLVIAGGWGGRFVDGTDGTFVKGIWIDGDTPDVTKDKYGNYWFLSVKHARCKHQTYGKYYPQCWNGVTHYKKWIDMRKIPPYRYYCPYSPGTNPCPTKIEIVSSSDFEKQDEKLIYGLGEEHTVPLGGKKWGSVWMEDILHGGAVSISANAHGDIAVTGCTPRVPPLVFLADSNYKTYFNGTCTKSSCDCEYAYGASYLRCNCPPTFVEPLGDRRSFLLNHTLSPSLGFFDPQTQSIQWAGEYTSRNKHKREFLLNISGDGGLATHLIWGRNWKPLTKVIFYYLFGVDGVE